MKTKIYKNVCVILFAIFIVGTVFCYNNLPNKIELISQNPSKSVFIIVSSAIMLTLTILSFFPYAVSKSEDNVRNEVMNTGVNLLTIGVFLYYFTILATYSGFVFEHKKAVVLIIGALMILVGNKLPQMPYRSLVGFKLPWILKDKFCWQKTHRFGGYTAIPFGILQCLIVLFTDNNVWAFIFGIGLWIVVVCVFSLVVYYHKSS